MTYNQQIKHYTYLANGLVAFRSVQPGIQSS